MGLVVRAYSRVVIAPDVEVEDGDVEDYENFTVFTNNENFPGRYEGLFEDTAYSWKTCAEVMQSSCTWYCLWRNQLQQLAGRDRQAFLEQIHFTDCEGTLGPVACAKLTEDYERFADEAEKVTDPMFRKVYQAFREGFALAADDGAVTFS